MIFISYARADSQIVEPIANRIGEIFGRDKVFFDRWAIQPGDGIVEGINSGLESAEFFFFFMSSNSITREMCKTEWQNALHKAAKKNLRFIPVRIDQSVPPAILTQTLYIDIYSHGQEAGLREIVDVVHGRNTYQPSSTKFHNVKGYVRVLNGVVQIEFRADHFMEPQSKYLILLDNSETDFSRETKDASFFSGFGECTQSDGRKSNGLHISRDSPTSPGFPFVVILTPVEGKKVKLIGLLKAQSHEQYEPIPIVQT